MMSELRIDLTIFINLAIVAAYLFGTIAFEEAVIVLLAVGLPNAGPA